MAGSERLAETWENAVHQLLVQLPPEKVIPMTIILLVDIILGFFAQENFSTPQTRLRETLNNPCP